MPAKKRKTQKKKNVKKATAKKQTTKVKQQVNSSGLITGTKDDVFPIVGIGASAGGLEALEGFFSNVPSDSNIAFVVIQHLAPKHKSIMNSLLKKHTDMDILPIKNGLKVKPNCVYLNPPNKNVSIINRHLCLTEPEKAHALNLPINHFFCSLAEDQAEKAICIILSGTGTDGTLGLKAIKDKGGAVMVQAESQAKYDNMPRSAIDSGMVDYILPVEKMPSKLIKYFKHPYVEGIHKKVAPEQQFHGSLMNIFLLIRTATGHDFSNYKQNTIRRRIERRMAVQQIERIEDYVKFLKEKPAEIESLYKDMLITVTNFFRDPEAFDIIEKKVIPSLLKDKSSDSPIRVWVPGCGTGEEAYSIAILLSEAMSKLKKRFEVQIFATDLDSEAIERGRAGVYPEAIAADVSPERLKCFFLKEGSTYKIKKQIREMLVFAPQNLIKDPPFSKLDIVSCRNLLIYLDTVLQNKILPLFHYTLNPNGIMFLGSSESIGEFSNLFEPIDVKWKIFKCKGSALGKIIDRPVLPFYDNKYTKGTKGKTLQQESDFRYIAEKAILDDYAPPCVLINTKHEILYFHGQTDKYLSFPTGEPSFNLLKMVREELRYKLNTALHDVAKQKKVVVYKDLQLKHNGNRYNLNLTVRPFTEPRTAGNLIMVVFEDTTVAKKENVKEKKTQISSGIENPRIAALEQELSSTKEYLQTTIEELETTNEEFKSTNEELQSTNEELQSTNEELETSREELQSTNEELETVNAELQNKVDELSYANNDLNNLLGSTEIGTIFLDMDLNIQRFTPSMTDLFNLRNADIGRPISDITSKITYKDFYQDAKEVLKTLEHKKEEIETLDGNYYSMNILPYRTTENVIDGIVITFVDITERVHSQQEVNNLAKFPDESPYPILRVTTDGGVLYCNAAGEQLLEKWKTDMGGKIPPKWQTLVTKAFVSKKRTEEEEEVKGRIYSITIAPINVEHAQYVNLYAREITDNKLAKNLRRLATVVQDSNDAITVQDMKGTIIAWNKGAVKMYGYTENEALGMNIYEIVPTNNKQKAINLIKDIAAGKTVDSLRTKRVTKDGRILDVWLTVTKLTDNENNVISVATTERDITKLEPLKAEK
jgi:two-component system CheB/CheR fusion protein